MGGALGTFLDYYLYPLFGLTLLALGAWCTWAVWRPRGPSPAARVAALILGGLGGWFLVNLAHAQGARQVTIGFPMPVLTLVKGAGHWMEMAGAASIPCLLLDLAIGVGLVHALLYVAWARRSRRRPRQGLMVRPMLRPLPARGRAALRQTRRELPEFELAERAASPSGRDS